MLLLFRKKIILEIHHDTKLEGRITNFILKYLNFFNQKNLIKIIAITNSVKNLFIKKFYVNPEKIIVLPSGSSIRINRIQRCSNYKRLKIGYFGSISPSKGINTLIKLSKIDKENDYYIYGGNRDELRKIKNRNIHKNLFLSENISYGNLPEIMMKMDILTLPYHKVIKSSGEVDDISQYTSPLKLFDYLALGKIIIASNLKVLKEVINHRNAYFVKNFENVFEWKKNIQIVKNSKKKNFIMSKNNLILSKKYDHFNRVKSYL